MQSAPDTAPTRKRSVRGKVKPSCEACYFGRRMLCALELDEPCSTFRPDSPQGLVPPTQPTLLVRAELEPEPEPDPAPELAGAA